MVGAELRFLRHVLGRTGSEFAAALDLSDRTVVSRWENGATRPGVYTEKVIRQLVLNLLARRAPGVEIGDNAIPGMKLRPRGEALPMAFALGTRRRADGRAERCYVPDSPARTAPESTESTVAANRRGLTPPVKLSLQAPFDTPASGGLPGMRGKGMPHPE